MHKSDDDESDNIVDLSADSWRTLKVNKLAGYKSLEISQSNRLIMNFLSFKESIVDQESLRPQQLLFELSLNA
jgi:hypothetical protein